MRAVLEALWEIGVYLSVVVKGIDLPWGICEAGSPRCGGRGVLVSAATLPWLLGGFVKPSVGEPA